MDGTQPDHVVHQSVPQTPSGVCPYCGSDLLSVSRLKPAEEELHSPLQPRTVEWRCEACGRTANDEALAPR